MYIFYYLTYPHCWVNSIELLFNLRFFRGCDFHQKALFIEGEFTDCADILEEIFQYVQMIGVSMAVDLLRKDSAYI
jgi:hypothetical protein